MGRYKSLTPSTRHFSGSLYGQPDGGAHVRAAGCSGREQRQIALLMGTTMLSKLGCDLNFPRFSFLRNSHDPCKGLHFKNPKIGLDVECCHCGAIQESVSEEQKRPQTSSHSWFLSFTVSSCVFANGAWPHNPLSCLRGCSLAHGPCEVGVYLPVCGHPGFMAVIQ